MVEWLAEYGIGETRLARIEDDRIVAAKLDWHEKLSAGARVPARLLRKSGAGRGVAETEDGEEILLQRVSPAASEGAAITVEITRAPVNERGRRKPAQGITTNEPVRAWRVADRLRDEGHAVREVRAFPRSEWDELMQEAFGGEIAFEGGSLLFSPTPAMTLVDIDGTLPPRELALAAIRPLADALHRFDLAGSIGIDFPTLQAKADRKAIDAALEEALGDYPHERTGMNGFGFVQIVARMSGPSILHRAQFRQTRAAICALLRRAERVREPGALLLTAHPALAPLLREEWQAELARRTGREIRWQSDPAVAIEGGFAQAVPL
ncbi:ribonuclease [Pseudoblastomonas halimionae]|uniref:Ribonuclease n=1 Tax=Alteriqipengyuania halimionae TaxID=1926630 RepID=A0A6I4U1U3_9SPHN|nr:ribonuclease [Alteriqipengyuania halimionae]MXP09878.1 ribonuclease [Alteriqipengyuania halimionae]